MTDTNTHTGDCNTNCQPIHISGPISIETVNINCCCGEKSQCDGDSTGNTGNTDNTDNTDNTGVPSRPVIITPPDGSDIRRQSFYASTTDPQGNVIVVGHERTATDGDRGLLIKYHSDFTVGTKAYFSPAMRFFGVVADESNIFAVGQSLVAPQTHTFIIKLDTDLNLVSAIKLDLNFLRDLVLHNGELYVSGTAHARGQILHLTRDLKLVKGTVIANDAPHIESVGSQLMVKGTTGFTVLDNELEQATRHTLAGIESLTDVVPAKDGGAWLLGHNQGKNIIAQLNDQFDLVRSFILDSTLPATSLTQIGEDANEALWLTAEYKTTSDESRRMILSIDKQMAVQSVQSVNTSAFSDNEFMFFHAYSSPDGDVWMTGQLHSGGSGFLLNQHALTTENSADKFESLDAGEFNLIESTHTLTMSNDMLVENQQPIIDITINISYAPVSTADLPG